MNFSNWPLLLLQGIPVALLVWTWRRRGREIALPMDHSDARSSLWLRGMMGVAESLPALALSAAFFILAGPYILSEPRSERVMTNIEFCVDVSGSMTASFGDGSRYDASMQAINQFLDYREGDAFGLTFFGNSVLHWTPLTNDASALRCSPPFMRPEQLPPWFGGTEIGKALRACQNVLRAREEGDRMIVLVSDGMSFDLVNGVDREIAKQLAEDEIVVYAIHIGENVPGEIVNITALTGGEVFQPGDPQAMVTVFESIDRMQQAKLKKGGSDQIDFFAPFCWAGLSLLGLATLCGWGLRYTPW